MDISFIRRAVARDQYEISQHAERERRNDGLSLADLESAVQTGRIIETYFDDPRGKSCLVFGWGLRNQPVHLVIGVLDGGWVRIITVYVPDPARWEQDWSTRKKG